MLCQYTTKKKPYTRINQPNSTENFTSNKKCNFYIPSERESQTHKIEMNTNIKKDTHEKQEIKNYPQEDVSETLNED